MCETWLFFNPPQLPSPFKGVREQPQNDTDQLPKIHLVPWTYSCSISWSTPHFTCVGNASLPQPLLINLGNLKAGGQTLPMKKSSQGQTTLTVIPCHFLCALAHWVAGSQFPLAFPLLLTYWSISWHSWKSLLVLSPANLISLEYIGFFHTCILRLKDTRVCVCVWKRFKKGKICYACVAKEQLSPNTHSDYSLLALSMVLQLPFWPA